MPKRNSPRITPPGPPGRQGTDLQVVFLYVLRTAFYTSFSASPGFSPDRTGQETEDEEKDGEARNKQLGGLL
jgi:hypothetical protein